MSFRARLLAACSALAALAGVFVVGVVLPPLRGQAGGSPLLPLGSPAEITALVLYPRNRQPLELRRRDGGWGSKGFRRPATPPAKLFVGIVPEAAVRTSREQ